METTLQLTVHAAPDYRYLIQSGPFLLDLIYQEDLNDGQPPLEVRISFGSPDEMKAVADALYRAAAHAGS